jgi:uncharacterized protein YuzE
MSVAFGDIIFDQVDYDSEVDVLYLSTGGVTPVERDESPEGHILRFDENGVICGMTIIGVSRYLDAEENARVTFPRRSEINLSGVDMVNA